MAQRLDPQHKLTVTPMERELFFVTITSAYRACFQRELHLRPDALCFLIRQDGIFVGWHFGWWLDLETYYMANSCILPEHRRSGFYSQFLKITHERLQNLGAKTLLSRHRPENTAVITAKLKQGFIPRGQVQDPRLGELLELVFDLSPALHSPEK